MIVKSAERQERTFKGVNFLVGAIGAGLRPNFGAEPNLWVISNNSKIAKRFRNTEPNF